MKKMAVICVAVAAVAMAGGVAECMFMSNGRVKKLVRGASNIMYDAGHYLRKLSKKM